MREVRLEVAFDEYVHMLGRVAPWLLEETEHTLRPFCHWLYGRQAFDVPLTRVDDETLQAYATEAALDAGARQALAAAVHDLKKFAAEQFPAA